MFSLSGVFEVDLIIIIALAEYPMRMTIIAVSKVLRVVLLFPAIYQITLDIITSTIILSTDEPEIIQIPVKKRAAMARDPFLTLFSEENENLTAKTNSTATRIT